MVDPVHVVFAFALSAVVQGNLPRALLVAALSSDPSGVVPLGPSGTDVFKEGRNCTIIWKPDTSGTWKETNIQLMSGPNSPMVPVTTVYTFDGTDQSLTNYSYPCPDVTPNSAIYFYQFSTPAASKNLTWTTRFTIAAADESTTPPANKTQPNGDAISWGTGMLVDQSKVVAPPSYLDQPSSPNTNISSSSSTSSSSSSTTGSSSSSSSSSSGSSPSTLTSQVTVTSVATSGSAAPTSGVTIGESGNGALHAQGNLAIGVVAMSLIAVVFGVLS